MVVFVNMHCKLPPLRLPFSILVIKYAQEVDDRVGATELIINTLYNVCAVPWGVFSTVGGVQYRGGIS